MELGPGGADENLTDENGTDENRWDDEQPLRGGVMRRLAAGSGGMSAIFGGVEQFYAPNAHRARQDWEEQKLVGAPAPAPTDPPDLRPSTGVAPGDRFRGSIVVRLPVDGSPQAPASPQ
jgi:hypothetical protein